MMDKLGMIYDKGADAQKEHVAAVKQRYPKP
jgi:hypothetical protein